MMDNSAAIPAQVQDRAVRHLVRDDGQEDLCFAIWFPSQGQARKTALVHDLVLPLDGERRVHGNASFQPVYFQRALAAATAVQGGLALMHSHPAPGWQGMSRDDIRAEESHAAAAQGGTGLPLVGMTIANDHAWSARLWEKVGPRRYECQGCRSVRVVGDRLSVTYHPMLVPMPSFRPELACTISAWGPEKQAQLARLHIGVIGCGSVGAMIAEALARMGVARIRLIDFDVIETRNLDRLLHATREDAARRRPKVDMLANALRKSATADKFAVEPLEFSVVEESGFRAALDCDVLFSCVDRPWPRSALNFVAYAHLVPVVDGGIFLETRPGNRGLRGADWRAHVAAPTRRCLECLGQYDAGLVQAEREGYFDDPTYIAGLPADHPIRRNENVFGFSIAAASLEILQFLSMVVAPGGVANPGAQMHHFVIGSIDRDMRSCDENCIYKGLVAKGDRAGLSVTGPHRVAQEARRQRGMASPAQSRKSPSWLRRWLPW